MGAGGCRVRSHATRRYLKDRTVEALGLLYAMHWPFRQPETARGVRRSILHDRLLARGACFGETAGGGGGHWGGPSGERAGQDNRNRGQNTGVN